MKDGIKCASLKNTERYDIWNSDVGFKIHTSRKPMPDETVGLRSLKCILLEILD